MAFEALQPKLPIMLKLLCNDDDDVSSTVVPFAHDYVSFLKQIVPLDNKQMTVIKVTFLYNLLDLSGFSQEGPINTRMHKLGTMPTKFQSV